MGYPSQHISCWDTCNSIVGCVYSVSSLFLVNNVQEDAMWVCRVEFSAIHISIAIRTASLAWSVQGEAASSHCLPVPLHSAVVLICTFWSNLN